MRKIRHLIFKTPKSFLGRVQQKVSQNILGIKCDLQKVPKNLGITYEKTNTS